MPTNSDDITPICSVFLHAKHWQVFGLLISGTLPVIFGNRLWPFGVLAELSYLAWLWCAGLFLTTIIEPALRLKFWIFRFDFFFFIFYAFVVISVFDKKLNLPVTLSNNLAVEFIPLHFLMMFSVLHILYFVSKSLLIAERDRPVSFSEYAGAFLLIWFLPLGVWTIQPRINRLCIAARDQAPEQPVLKSPA